MVYDHEIKFITVKTSLNHGEPMFLNGGTNVKTGTKMHDCVRIIGRRRKIMVYDSDIMNYSDEHLVNKSTT